MTFKLTPDHVDTWLKTRDGRKVKCVLHEDDDFVFMNLNNVYDVWFSKADGYFKDDETEHDKDIIGEWKEPEFYEGWIPLFCTSGGEHYHGTLLLESKARATNVGGAIDAIYIKHTIGEQK